MATDTYTVARSVTVDASPASVYAQIANFHHWVDWSPWEGVDPAMVRTYSGPESGVGAQYGWTGNRKAGQGRMTITDASEPFRLQIDLVFDKPWKAHNDTVFTIEPQGSGSRVTWSMTGKKTPVIRVMGLVRSMDKLLGPDFDKGLARLRTAAQKPVAS